MSSRSARVARPAVVSIVCVSHQSRSYILGALASAQTSAQASGLDFEAIVVDNASTDGTADLVRAACPWVRLICNPVNVGFGRANNQAFELATGSILVLLNPDATLDPDAVAQLVTFLQQEPRAAAVAPSLRGPGSSESAGMLPGLRSIAGHFLLLNRLLPEDRGGAWRGLLLRRTPETGPRRVEWVSGAAMALDATAVRAVGGFDPGIFLYAEDLDLCERFAAAERSVWLLPSATGSHLTAGSQGRHSTGWVDGVHGYYRARSGRARLALFDFIMAGGLAVRGVGTGRGRSREELIHRRNMRAGARRAVSLLYASLAGRG